MRSERITGVPVSVINSASIRRMGTKPGALARWLLSGDKTKHLMRTIYALGSIIKLKKSLKDQSGNRDFWQAGKSVKGITQIKTVAEIIASLSSENSI